MRSPVTITLMLAVSCLGASSLSAQQPIQPPDSGKASAAAKAHGKAAITVVVPPTGEKAYQIAGDVFVDMWERVTGRRPGLTQSPAEAAAVKRFCRARYPGKLAASMAPVWSKFLVTSQTAHWSMRGTERVVLREPQFHMLTSPWLTFTPQRIEELLAEHDKLRAGLEPAPEVLAELAALTDECHDNPLWRRDALDMARTIANRALLATLMDAVEQMEAWRQNQADPETIRQMAQLNRQLLDALGDLLALSDDYSMTATLQRLQRARPLGGLAATLNPHSEQTLKGNAENDYCRSHHYELVRYVYPKEVDVFWDYVLERLDTGERAKWGRPPESAQRTKAIEDEFFATPLAQMAPQGARGAEEFAEAFHRLEDLVKQYLATTGSLAAPIRMSK